MATLRAAGGDSACREMAVDTDEFEADYIYDELEMDSYDELEIVWTATP